MPSSWPDVEQHRAHALARISDRYAVPADAEGWISFWENCRSGNVKFAWAFFGLSAFGSALTAWTGWRIGPVTSPLATLIVSAIYALPVAYFIKILFEIRRRDIAAREIIGIWQDAHRKLCEISRYGDVLTPKEH